jgi:hypothetical protein
VITPAAGAFAVATFGVDARGFALFGWVVDPTNGFGANEDAASGAGCVNEAPDVGFASDVAREFDFASNGFAGFAVDDGSWAGGWCCRAAHEFTLYRIPR